MNVRKQRKNAWRRYASRRHRGYSDSSTPSNQGRLVDEWVETQRNYRHLPRAKRKSARRRVNR